MPSNTPLTATPTALLTDAANIETAVPPGFSHLERFAIPRFVSLSARNAAFAEVTPEVGQVIYVFSQGHLGYQVWNGTTWEEFGQYTRIRTTTNLKTVVQEINSVAIFANISELTFPVKEGETYRFSVMFLANQLTGTTRGNISTNFTFPGSGSRCSAGGTGPGVDSLSLTNNAGGNFGNNTNRPSGDLVRSFGVFVGSTSNIELRGTLKSQGTGTFQVQARKHQSNDGPISILADSYVDWQRIG